MGKLKIKFHPLFALYFFVCIYFNWFNKIFYYVLAVTLHEYGHYFVAKYYGYKIDSLIYSLSGAGITTKEQFKIKDEIKIASAGPIVNIILILLMICLWWLFPLSYLYTYDFLICNLVVLLFNLLPIYPLDGGRIILAVLCLKNYNREKILNKNKVVSFILASIFFVLFIISLFFKCNLNLLIIGMFLIINNFTCKRNKYYDKIQTLQKSKNKPIEIKVFKVHEENKKHLIKYLNPNYISVFKNEIDGKIETINEEDLFE